MTPEATPAASLTSVRVRRRKQPRAPSGKRGDLTAAELAALSVEPLLPREPAGAVILLPAQSAEPAASLIEAAPQEATPAEESPEPQAEAELLELPEPLELSLITCAEEEVRADIPEREPPAVVLPLPAPAAPPEDEPAAMEAALAPDPGDEMDAGEEDILDYWDSLRGGRDFPALDDVDRTHVGATWPNTLLLAVEATELPRITRLGAADGEIDYTATVIDWIMSRARHSAKRGEAMEEERRFAVSTGSARYRMLLLPLSSYGLSCDHVLCQLSRLPELGAVASIKRWFAS